MNWMQWGLVGLAVLLLVSIYLVVRYNRRRNETPQQRAHRLRRKAPLIHKLAVTSTWITMLLMLVVIGLPPLELGGSLGSLAKVNLRFLVGDTWMATLIRYAWVYFAVYILIENLETITRPSTKMKRFAADNLSALLLAVLAIGLFIVRGVRPERFAMMGEEEFDFISMSLGFGLVDLFAGLLGSQRIAFAGKEREEEDATNF